MPWISSVAPPTTTMPGTWLGLGLGLRLGLGLGLGLGLWPGLGLAMPAPRVRGSLGTSAFILSLPPAWSK